MSLFSEDIENRTAVVALQTAEFLSRPSIALRVPIKQIGGLFATINHEGKTITYGNSPDEALRKYDSWFFAGKEQPTNDKQ